MKSISKLLLIAMIVSVFASFGGFAADYAAQDIINAVKEEKIWTDGEFAAEKEITAAQLAAMMNVALGIDNASKLIPSYADGKIITRKDLAVAADKAGFATVDYYENKTVYRDLYMDTDAVTDAEFQSITNAIFYGTVIALPQKKFAPEQKADALTAAKAVLTLKCMAKSNMKFEVRDVKASDKVDNYDVYQTGVLQTNAGVAGFGMVARFDKGPGEIYVARTTVKPILENQWGNPAAPVTLVRVVDPDGNIIARVNLDYVSSGKMEKIIKIPEGKAGIYQIQFTNGRDGDLCEIAVNDAKSWGIRGEHAFAYTDTTPNPGYVYIPKSSKHLSLATGGPDDVLTVTASDGEKFELVQAIRCTSLQAIEIPDPIVDTVYTINAENNFRNFFEIRGATNLICPTAEMAKDLKGGFVDSTDEYASWTLAGPLQARARAKMIDIYKKAEGNFVVNTDKPFDELPAMEDLDNPIAETQLYSTYYGSIPAMDIMLQGQCLDPTSPWFGMVVGHKIVNGQSKYPENSFLSEHYSINIFGTTTSAFTGALSINSELNGFYNDPQLRDRTALAQLACVLNMTQDGDIIDSSDPKDDAGSWYLTYTNFKFPDWAHNYYSVRKMLDTETREICDTALMLVADKQVAMRGQGPTNQAAMNFYGTLAMYEATGDEAFHTFFKRQVDAYLYPNARPSYHGQTEAGYYLEAGGCDGASYQLHNEDFFSRAYMTYFNLPKDKQDPEVVAKLKASSKRNLDFMEKWQTGRTDGLDQVYATNFASRTRSGLGGGSAYIANNFLINHMPQARAIWSNETKPSIFTSGAYANTDERAYENLKKSYSKYDKYYGTNTDRGVGNSLMYEEMHEPLAENVTLPYQYEGDYNVWDQPGLVAIKHKGLYLVSFYDSTMPRTQNFISPKVWQGGAPTFTWTEGVGYATSSDKPVNYNAIPGNMLQISNKINYKPYWKEEEFIHAGIVGTDANGEVFASGKERSDLVWLENGKSFKISGVTPIEQKEISWIYDMTDEGIEITAGIDSISGKEEFWMQIPVVDQSILNSDYSVKHEPGKLTVEYRGKKFIITWDASLQYKMNDHQPENKVRTQVLKIKLPAETCKATIKMIAE